MDPSFLGSRVLRLFGLDSTATPPPSPSASNGPSSPHQDNSTTQNQTRSSPDQKYGRASVPQHFSPSPSSPLPPVPRPQVNRATHNRFEDSTRRPHESPSLPFGMERSGGFFAFDLDLPSSGRSFAERRPKRLEIVRFSSIVYNHYIISDIIPFMISSNGVILRLSFAFARYVFARCKTSPLLFFFEIDSWNT